MYSRLKPYLFRQDPEQVHERVMKVLAWTAEHPAALRLVGAACTVPDPRLKTRAFGLTFPNPVGLAAGFDKNAVAIPAWAALGFGFVEIGSVTEHAQPGNPKPRLFRLPEDEGLINRLGFNNEGAEVVAARLELYRREEPVTVPVGVNVGKSKVTPLEDAPGDYLASLALLWPHADYFVLNVSSPNTPGLRALQERGHLERLLGEVRAFAADRSPKPVLLKLAPDLDDTGLAEAADMAVQFGLAGLVATNTTVTRTGLRSAVEETGGLSGKPLRERSLEVLRFLTSLKTGLPIIAVGGVGTVDDVAERLQAGAALVQLYTSLVYEGPFLLKTLNRGLLQRLEQGTLTLNGAA